MPRAEDHYLTHDQLEALAAACGRYTTLVRVLGYAGLRWGEAVALRVGRVDVLRGRLDIADAMTEVNGGPCSVYPRRTNDELCPSRRSCARTLPARCEGNPATTSSSPHRGAGCLRGNVFRRSHWDRACIKIGVGEMVDGRYRGLTPHDLRHAAASFAIASGASVKGVQSMLGHSSATQTLDRYAALWPDELEAVAERIDAARSSEISRTRRGLSVVSLDPTKRQDVL